MIRVLLADDHPIITKAIELILEDEQDIEVVKAVHNGQEIIETLGKEKVDIVIADIEMPKMDGFEVAKAIVKGKDMNTRIILYSIYVDEAKVNNAIKLGVDGYLDKGCRSEEIYEAIRKVNAGEQYYSEKIQGILESAKDLVMPTKREKEIIPYLDKGLSDKDIAEKLEISAYTVSDHVKNLFRKYEANSRTELIYILRQKGLI